VLLKSTAADPRGFICKLADFGLSRMLDLNKTHVSTQTYGTLPFMPVELLSEGHMGKSADVYSFAVVMWSLMTGDQPHHGMNTMQVLFNVVNKGMRPPVPDTMPAPYRALMEACWSQRAEDRPTVQQLNRELTALLETEAAARRQMISRDRAASSPSSGSGRSDSGSEAAGRTTRLPNIKGRLDVQPAEAPVLLSPHAVAAAAAARLRGGAHPGAGGMQRSDRTAAGPASALPPPSVPPPILEEDDKLDDAAAAAPASLPEPPASQAAPAELAVATAAQLQQDAGGKQSGQGATQATKLTAS
jgi:serine/threonine protein kinase